MRFDPSVFNCGASQNEPLLAPQLDGRIVGPAARAGATTTKIISASIPSVFMEPPIGLRWYGDESASASRPRRSASACDGAAARPAPRLATSLRPAGAGS